jgi:hypothetical protein
MQLVLELQLNDDTNNDSTRHKHLLQLKRVEGGHFFGAAKFFVLPTPHLRREIFRPPAPHLRPAATRAIISPAAPRPPRVGHTLLARPPAAPRRFSLLARPPAAPRPPRTRADAVGHAPRRELVARAAAPRPPRAAGGRSEAGGRGAPRPPVPERPRPAHRELLEAAAKPAARPAFRVLTARGIVAPPWETNPLPWETNPDLALRPPVVRTSEWVSFGFRVENAGVL